VYDGAFTLREAREAHTSVFAGKNDLLRLDNSRFDEENVKYKAHSVVRPRNIALLVDALRYRR